MAFHVQTSHGRDSKVAKLVHNNNSTQQTQRSKVGAKANYNRPKTSPGLDQKGSAQSRDSQ